MIKNRSDVLGTIFDLAVKAAEELDQTHRLQKCDMQRAAN